MAQTDLDLLCVGECLIDFISTESVGALTDAEQFQRHLGGSPANITVTMARLGGRAAIASRVGAKAFGQFIQRELEKRGVITEFLRHDPENRTTVIFVTRTTGTPEFEVFHGADAELAPEDVPDSAIERARIIHTSTFALSRNPCRTTAAGVLKRASAMGKIVSLDPNYNSQLWPDLEEARSVLRELYAYCTITTPSMDDSARLFGEGKTPEEYIRHFHELGPRTVVLTLGKDGALLSHEGVITHVPARRVEVKDATGAGDAYWGGFLTALLDGMPLERCAQFANVVVSQKLQHVGHLIAPMDKAAIYAEAE